MTARVVCPIFVGRAGERAALRGALGRAGEGLPTAALIAGEAGVGKTRLVTEFSAEAGGTGAVVLAGACPPLASGLLAYAPLVAALRPLADRSGPDVLRWLSGRVPLPPDALVPAHSDQATARTTTARDLLEPLLALVEQVSAQQTVVLVIEDLQWADPSTLDFLAFLHRNLRQGRLLLIITVRTDDLWHGHPLRPVLAEFERSGVERIDLPPLAAEEMTQQLTGILQRPPSPEASATIYARSGGNPFFAEELLVAAGGGTELPLGLRNLLLARVQALSGSTQRLLEAVAIAARPVEHWLLASVMNLSEDELLAALRQATEHHVLVVEDQSYGFRHALLQEAIDEDLLPGERVRLHRRFAEAITERSELSAEFAAVAAAAVAHHWFHARDFDRALPAIIAAGLAAEAIPAMAESLSYFRQALELWPLGYHPDRPPVLNLVDLHRHSAEAAHMIGEDGEAIALTTAAIALVDENIEPVRAGLLHERLARYLYTGGGDESAVLSACRRAVRLVPEGDSAERARVLASMGQALMLSARFHESRPYCVKAADVARKSGAADEEVAALVSLATDLCHDGEETERGIFLLRRSLDTALDAGALEEAHRAYANLGDALTDSLRLDEATTFLTEGAGAAERLGFIGAGSALRCDAVEPLLLAGRWDDAAGYLADADRGRRYPLTHARFHLSAATLQLRRGDFRQAHDHLHELVELLSAGSQSAEMSNMRAVTAELALEERRVDDAADEVAGALPALETGENTYLLALVLWLGLHAQADLAGRTINGAQPGRQETGERRPTAATLLGAVRDIPGRLHPVPRATLYLLLAEAEYTRVEGGSDVRSWEVAAERLEQTGCTYLAAYARWRQAEAVMSANRSRPQARQILTPAYAEACRLGALPLRQEIEALARRSGIDLHGADAETSQAESRITSPNAADLLGLTSREAEVLGQLSLGRTNRQIASALYVSEKTVATHVSHILAKLGAANRLQAAATAHRLGLAPAV